MSSVLDFVPCKQCNETASYLFYATGEKSVLCPVCGYDFQRIILKNRKLKAEDPKYETFKLNKNGDPIFRTYERKGYGACCVKFVNGRGYAVGFHKPITPSVIASFKRYLSRQQDVNFEATYLTRWNEDTNQAEAVVGKIVNPYASPLEEESGNEATTTDDQDFLPNDLDDIPYDLDDIPF